MAADVQIHEMTATSTGVDKTSSTVRFKSADETSVDSTNRMQVPSSGTNYSYTKQLRFYFNTAPATSITNLECYTDGTNSFGTGITVEYDTSGSFSSNVQTDISGTDLFTKTSSSTIDMDVTNTGPHTSTGYKGDFVRMQMQVADTASPGALSAEPMTFVYDES